MVWGANDPSFIAAGAQAFSRDLPNAEIHQFDAEHFALDEKTDEIADLILQFMAKHPGSWPGSRAPNTVSRHQQRRNQERNAANMF